MHSLKKFSSLLKVSFLLAVFILSGLYFSHNTLAADYTGNCPISSFINCCDSGIYRESDSGWLCAACPTGYTPNTNRNSCVSLTGSITANDCTIATGESNCVSNISWTTTANEVTGFSLYASGHLFSSGGSDGNAATGKWITNSGVTFTLKGPDNYVISTKIVKGNCESRSSWDTNNGTCKAIACTGTTSYSPTGNAPCYTCFANASANSSNAACICNPNFTLSVTGGIPSCVATIVVEYASVFGYTCSAAATRGGSFKMDQKGVYWQGQGPWSATLPPSNTQSDRIDFTKITIGGVTNVTTNAGSNRSATEAASLSATIDTAAVVTNPTCRSVNTNNKCYLFTSHRDYASQIIDIAYNEGTLQNIGAVEKCVVSESNPSTGVLTTGNVNTPGTAAYTWPTNANSCWLKYNANGVPVLAGNTNGSYTNANSQTITCKDYFSAQCSIQFSNAITYTNGLYDFDTQKCSFPNVKNTEVSSPRRGGVSGIIASYFDKGDTALGQPAVNAADMLSIELDTPVSQPAPYNNKVAAINSKFPATSANIYSKGWNRLLYTTPGSSAIRVENRADAAHMFAACGVGYYASGVSPAGPVSLPASSLCNVNGGIVTENGVTFQRYSKKDIVQGCCLGRESYVGVGFMLCDGENRLYGQAESCIDACANGFSPYQIPPGCSNATPKQCSCSAAGRSWSNSTLQGSYTVKASEDCANNSPAAQPATCAALAPVITCGVSTAISTSATAINVPQASCSLLAQAVGGSVISGSATNIGFPTMPNTVITGLSSATNYNVTMSCGGTVRASAVCSTSPALVCTNGNTTQDVVSGSFNPSTMTTNRVVESSGACASTFPSVPICMTTAGGNPTLFTQQALGAPTTLSANTEICFDSVKNRVRLAMNTTCGDTGVRSQTSCPAPTLPIVTSTGATVFVGDEATVSIGVPKANMECALYGRTATGIDGTNIAVASTTYTTLGNKDLVLPATKQSVAQVYGYNAVCAETANKSNKIESAIIEVNVIALPTATVNVVSSSLNPGIATINSVCTGSDFIGVGTYLPLIKVLATSTIPSGTSSFSSTTPADIFLGGSTSISAPFRDGTTMPRTNSASLLLQCTKSIPGLRRETANAKINVGTSETKVLVDISNSTSPIRAFVGSEYKPLSDINVIYSRFGQTTSDATGYAYATLPIGMDYNVKLGSLPDYLEYIGLKDDKNMVVNKSTYDTQPYGDCTKVATTEVIRAKYAEADFNANNKLDASDLEKVRSLSGATCSGSVIECAKADLNNSGGVNSADINIMKNLVDGNIDGTLGGGVGLVTSCLFNPALYAADTPDDKQTFIAKYKDPLITANINSITSEISASCTVGDGLYIDKLSPAPKTSIFASSTYSSGYVYKFPGNLSASYEVRCSNHNYATTTVSVSGPITISVKENPMIKVKEDAILQWTSTVKTCAVYDFDSVTRIGGVVTGTGSGPYDFSFTLSTTSPMYRTELNSSHLDINTPPNSLGYNIKCFETNNPTRGTSTSPIKVQVYKPTVAAISEPDPTGKIDLRCTSDYDYMNITRSDNVVVTGYPVTYPYNRVVNNTVSINPVSGVIYTLVCKSISIPENISQTVYPKGGLLLSGNISGDVSGDTGNTSATDEVYVHATSSIGKFSALGYVINGADTWTVNKRVIDSIGVYASTITNGTGNTTVSLGAVDSGYYPYGAEWIITVIKGAVTKKLHLVLGVQFSPVAQIVSITPSASSYAISIRCQNSTSYEIQNITPGATTATLGTGSIGVSNYTNTVTVALTPASILNWQVKLICKAGSDTDEKLATVINPLMAPTRFVSFSTNPPEVTSCGVSSSGEAVDLSWRLQYAKGKNCRVTATSLSQILSTDPLITAKQKDIDDINTYLAGHHATFIDGVNRTTGLTQAQALELEDSEYNSVAQFSDIPVKYSTRFIVTCNSGRQKADLVFVCTGQPAPTPRTF